MNLRNSKHLVISSLLYLILWFIASNFLLHGINTDSISYFSISKKYFNGNFFEAINACWGPLFSWLILPSFSFNLEPHIYSRILFGILSIFFLILIYKFFVRLNLTEKTRSLGIYFFILPAIFFTFYRLTPDYILLILTLVYIYISTTDNFWNRRNLVLLSSVFGALMFLTKSYGLMFFIAYQTIILMMDFIYNKKINRTIFSNYLFSLILFLILISPWIYLLSNKYGGLTVSTSGIITFRIMNPELNFRHPSIESGFVAPSDKYAVSAWDDPDLNAYPNWNPLSSFDNFKFFLINTAKNIIKLFIFILAFAPLLSSLIVFLKKKDFLNPVLLKILVAGLIYGLGYTMIYVENRYVWPSLILFALVGLVVLNYFSDKIFYNKIRPVILSILIICSSLPFFMFGMRQQLTTTSEYNQARIIKNEYGISGNFASTNYWHHGLALSYFLESKFYGTEKLAIDSPELLEKAKKFNINYIFDYSNLTPQRNNLIFIGKIDSLKIYRITDQL